ncbi:MAG: hypothetical protein HY074_05895 [Deltaproteobacteria bacterium]|nr:hypothetical protein [Deltaproteobacteria bacterium]
MMNLPQPEIPVLKSYPQGADPAAVFPDGVLTLTYWDLWSLISAKHRFGSDLSALRKSLVDRRLNQSHHGMSRKEQIEDLIALVDDLGPRIKRVGGVDKVLATIPERLLKKEMQKGIKNITDDWGGYYPPSEPMLRSPRRLLEKEAMRGMWPRLPFDPTPIAETLRPLFIPKKKSGYFPKGTTFALSRRVEKAMTKELSKSDGLAMNHRAHRYAIHRAALTLFHEEHHWDDSYGVMGDLAKQWVDALLSVTADDLCLDPRVFLKDLLMFLCWENYGLTDDDVTSTYIRRLPEEERVLAFEILADVEVRAAQGFQQYNAKNATKLLERGGTDLRPAPMLRMVTHVATLDCQG